MIAQVEAQRQQEDVNATVNGDVVPDDREDTEVKKKGLMGKIRNVRVSGFFQPFSMFTH